MQRNITEQQKRKYVAADNKKKKKISYSLIFFAAHTSDVLKCTKYFCALLLQYAAGNKLGSKFSCL